MKAITAGRDWWSLTFRTVRYLIERTILCFKTSLPVPASQVAASTASSLAAKKEPAVDAPGKTNNTGDFYSSQFIVMYGIQPSWDMERILEGLRDLKLSFGPFSKVIVYTESYVDELVHRCEDFNYDAYLLTCDGRDELKKAVHVLQEGKWYLSRSVITAYCVTRRKE